MDKQGQQTHATPTPVGPEEIAGLGIAGLKKALAEGRPVDYMAFIAMQNELIEEIQKGSREAHALIGKLSEMNKRLEGALDKMILANQRMEEELAEAAKIIWDSGFGRYFLEQETGEKILDVGSLKRELDLLMKVPGAPKVAILAIRKFVEQAKPAN